MSKSKSLLWGFIAGAVTGATVGFLFAPDKGKNTRKKLQRETDRLNDAVMEEVSHGVKVMKHQLSDSIKDLKSCFSTLEKELCSKMKKAEKQGEQLIDEVEEIIDTESTSV